MLLLRRFFLFLILLGCLGLNTYAATWYVSPSGSNITGDGTSGNPWQTIQFAINSVYVVAGDVVSVAAGTYNESISVSKAITLSGAGMDQSTIKGLKTVGQSVFLSSNTILEGFTVTRDGNNTTDWATNANTSGIIVGQASTGAIIRNCKVTENRNGIYLNNALSVTITNNLIVNNRTGIQLTHNVSNLLVINNIITGNWTHGFVIYYGSAGQAATTNAQIHYNNISGNWFSQVECKTVVANPTVSYDFTNNWWGSATLNVVSTPAGEPGYAAQIPVQFGGAAVSPGGNEGKICGDLVALVDYNPYWEVNYLSDKPVLSYPVNGSTGHPVKPRLEWDAFPGAYSYDIEISKVQPFAGATSIYYNTFDLHFDIPADLQTSSTYYWRVRGRGIDNIDASQWSNVWNFTTTASGISQTGVPVLTHPILNATVYTTNTTLYWYNYQFTAGVTLYEIEYKEGNADFTSGTVNQLTSSTTNAAIQNLIAGSTYYWRVRIYNGGMNLYSEWSDVESFTVIGSISSAPVKPIASHPVNNMIINYDNTPVLYWYVMGTNNYTYQVIVENASTFATVFTSSTGIGATNIEVGTALPNGTYRWKVRSINSVLAVSEWSDYAYFTIEGAANTSLQIPIVTHPINNATVYSLTPKFYWYITNYTSDIIFDVLVQGVPGGGADGYLGTCSGTTTNCQWTFELIPGAQYQWSVRTIRNGSASSYSEPQLFTIYNNAQAAAKPTASWPVSNATVYVNPPILYWYTGSSAIGVTYDIQLEPALDNFGNTMVASGVESTNYQLTSNLTSGIAYKWRVRSVVNNVASAWSDVATFTMNGTLIADLPQPSLIYPVGNFTVYTTSPTLHWYSAYSAATTQYRVIVAIDPELLYPVSGSPFTATEFNLTVSGLVPGATYYWGVQSSNGSAYSNMSAIGSFTVNAGSSPVVPNIGGPDGIDLQESSAVLNWYLPVASTSQLTYELEYSTSPDFSKAVTKTGLSTTSYCVSDLQGGAEYYWRVKSIAGGNTSSGYSLSGSFTTSGVTDVAESIIPDKFEVAQNYPNPFNPVTNISVNLPENAELTVKIYNILGQEIKTLINQEMEPGVYTFQWNGDNNFGSKVPSGTYIYKVTAGEYSQSLKMMLLK